MNCMDYLNITVFVMVILVPVEQLYIQLTSKVHKIKTPCLIFCKTPHAAQTTLTCWSMDA